jgi:hypothetical protein
MESKLYQTGALFRIGTSALPETCIILQRRIVLSINRRQVRTSNPIVRESRRSTRVSLKVLIKAYGIEAPVTCEGETIVVNLHGALISTAIGLSAGMMIDIHVYLTDKRAIAKVAYVD